MHQILANADLYYEVKENMALILGVISCLLILVPSVRKRRRINRIIENGKANKTFIIAKRISYKHYKKRKSSGGGLRNTYNAEYEYMLNGKRYTYHFFGGGYPPTELAMYYDGDKNEVHAENEIIRMNGFWSLPFLVGIAVGIGFLLLTYR